MHKTHVVSWIIEHQDPSLWGLGCAETINMPEALLVPSLIQVFAGHTFLLKGSVVEPYPLLPVWELFSIQVLLTLGLMKVPEFWGNISMTEIHVSFTRAFSLDSISQAGFVVLWATIHYNLITLLLGTKIECFKWLCGDQISINGLYRKLKTCTIVVWMQNCWDPCLNPLCIMLSEKML